MCRENICDIVYNNIRFNLYLGGELLLTLNLLVFIVQVKKVRAFNQCLKRMLSVHVVSGIQ